MKNLLIALFLCITFSANSQNKTEEQAVIDVIKTFFDGMRASDTTQIRKTLETSARLQTTIIDKDGYPRLVNGSMEKFIEVVGTPHEQIWDEKIWSYDVHVDDNLATAWTEYSFFLGEKLSHCGVNAFHLFKSTRGWKITQITDTRRFENCKQEPEDEVNILLNNWHKAAATADEDVFFGSMTADAIYLGTDATERWGRDEMRKWSKQYFDRDSAWVFHVIKREVYFSEDGSTAWFEESLDTWMGECRGSGVLVKTDDAWKLKHYNLSVPIPNDKMDAFLELMNPLKEEVIKESLEEKLIDKKEDGDGN